MTCILLLAMPGSALAQQDTTVLDDEHIDIVKEYVPVVSRATKKHLVPRLPSVEQTRPVYDDYEIRAPYMSTEPAIAGIRPLRYPSESLSPLPYVYVRAGLGNYRTPLFDLRAANKRTDKFMVGVSLEHLSSRRKKIENQRFSETSASMHAEAYIKGHTLRLRPFYERDNHHFFGYEGSDTSLSAAATRNLYHRGGVEAAIYNHETSASGVDYRTDIVVNALRDDHGNKEVEFRWDARAEGRLNEILRAGGGLFFDAVSLRSLTNVNRYAFGLNPYITAGKEKWSIRGGLWVLFNDGDWHALPDIRHQSRLYKDHVVLYNEWIGHLELNSLGSLSKELPWLSQVVTYAHFRTEQRNFIGVRGNLPIGLDYDARFSQLVQYDVPLAVNDTNLLRSFNLVYDDRLTALNSHVSLGYRWAQFLHVRLSLDHYRYRVKDALAAYHRPAFRSDVSVIYHYDHKLILKASLFAFSGVKAIGSQGVVNKLKGNVDLNVAANYHLNDYIAFFAQVNNALSMKHERWQYHPGYGFLFVGGIIASY